VLKNGLEMGLVYVHVHRLLEVMLLLPMLEKHHHVHVLVSSFRVLGSSLRRNQYVVDMGWQHIDEQVARCLQTVQGSQRPVLRACVILGSGRNLQQGEALYHGGFGVVPQENMLDRMPGTYHKRVRPRSSILARVRSHLFETSSWHQQLQDLYVLLEVEM
jgi:hypothetical protein